MVHPFLLRRAGWRGGVCVLTGAMHAAGVAQTTAYPLDPVLVTAARLEQRLADSLPAATVISRAQIESSQSTDLVELLGRQAGIEFARAGGPGGQASLFLRGTNSSQVLVLLDGVRLNTALGGAAALGGISLDAVDRIEIVRGNLSSLYGSEAIGGVIQIFTRGADRSGAEVGAEAGSGDARAGSLHVAQTFAGGSIALTAATRQASPYSAIDASRVVATPFAAGANADVDGNRKRSGTMRAQGQAGPVGLEAGIWSNHSDTDFDSTTDGPAATHDERSRQQAMHISAGASLTERWHTRLTLAQAKDDTRNRSSDPLSFDNSQFEARNRTATLANQVQVAERVTATLLYEHLQQRGASSSYDPAFAGALTRFSRRVNSLQFGLLGGTNGQQVQMSVRRDDYSDVGGATTGLLAYGYPLSRRWRVSAQLASSFRAPSFNDLYFPFFGNRALSPERARSGELALRYSDGDTVVRAGLFHTRLRDLIVYDAASSQVRNVARADADGLELMASTQWHGWRLRADASLTRARDRTTGERLLRRAPYAIHLAAMRSYGRWDGVFEVSRSGARYDSDINTFARKRLAPYTLARAALSWRLSDALRLNLRAENLFDADYVLVDGYNTQRRSLFAGVTVWL
jgi:vitamin B12 transporter